MGRMLSQAVRLLELTTAFDLNWSLIEQRVVNCLLKTKAPKRRRVARRLRISETRLSQLIREIISRLNPVDYAITSGAFDPQNVRTWPIVLLRLDDGGRYSRRLENLLLSRNITMVAQLLGPDSPLAKQEFRKGLGQETFGALEAKLKPFGLFDELAWRIRVPDSRRAWQDEIERRIHELTQPESGTVNILETESKLRGRLPGGF